MTHPRFARDSRIQGRGQVEGTRKDNRQRKTGRAAKAIVRGQRNIKREANNKNN